jgi:predicted transcriptional regulator
MDAGFFQLRNKWVKDKLRNLTTPELRVYLVLRAHRFSATGISHPSLKTLAKETGIARSGVQKGLDRLEQRGLIERSLARWENSGKFSYNEYRVLDEDQGTNTPKQVMARYLKTGNGDLKPQYLKRGNKQEVPKEGANKKQLHEQAPSFLIGSGEPNEAECFEEDDVNPFEEE